MNGKSLAEWLDAEYAVLSIEWVKEEAVNVIS